jgi:proteasome alpha subunit
MGGNAEQVGEALEASWRADLDLGAALQAAVAALSVGDGANVNADGLEVAVLDRDRIGRQFRRLTSERVRELLG